MQGSPRRADRFQRRWPLLRLLASHRGELGEIVRADQLDLAAGKLREFAQAREIGAPLSVVDARERLEQAKALRRRPFARLDFGAMEIGVATVEQPTVRSPDRDAAMPARVARQGNEQRLVARSGNGAHGLKAEPGFARFLDRRPSLDRGDLGRAVAAALGQARRVRGGAKLGGEDMHRRAREIADPSGMVEIEMSGHDVANVARTEAEVRHLPQRRLGDLEPRPHDGVEQETEPPGFLDVLNPEPGVDQEEAVFALDQEAVSAHRRGRQWRAGAAEQPPAARTQGPAIEVMDAHRSSGRPRLSQTGPRRPPAANRAACNRQAAYSGNNVLSGAARSSAGFPIQFDRRNLKRRRKPPCGFRPADVFLTTA